MFKTSTSEREPEPLPPKKTLNTYLVTVWSPGTLATSQKQNSKLHTPMWETEMHMRKCLLKHWTHMVTKQRERKPCHVSLCRPFQRLSVSSAYETKKKNNLVASLITGSAFYAGNLLLSLFTSFFCTYGPRSKYKKNSILLWALVMFLFWNV